jgi:pyrimidine deaminase RibD-like protein
MNKYLNIAIKVAIANNSYPRKRHGAALVRGGSVLSVGWNCLKVEGSRHAEVHAIDSALSHTTGATLYVARVGMDNVPRLSLPCEQCRQAITSAGIRRVVYTIDKSAMGYWKPLTQQ